MKVTQIHCGQDKRYGDFFRVWTVETDKSEEEVLDYLFANVYNRKVPPVGEWSVNVRDGGEKSGDMAYYFAGYYDLEKVVGGYKFTVCEPYAD